MIDLDTSRLAPDIANVLLLRGAELPPLQWPKKPNQAAKELLDRAAEDTTLFRRNTLASEEAAAAVRAMLYLWNGWPVECEMYAQAAPDGERLYLGALRERQTGNAAESKRFLQQLREHPVYEPLRVFALEAIGLGTDPPLQRFKQTLELAQEWEPHLFVDLFEQARVGKLCHATELVVRRIQCREFELLFVRCYEAATGEPLPQPPSTQPALPRKRPARPAARPPRRPAPERPVAQTPEKAGSDSVAPTLGAHPLSRKGPRIGVRCPKCQTMAILPESRRGTKERCVKCDAVFLVPSKKSEVHPGSSTEA